MDHRLVGGHHEQFVFQLRRAQPILDLEGLLVQPQAHQEPDQLIHPVARGHAEIEQMLGHLDRRGRHPELDELPGPQEVGPLQQPVVLRRAFFLEHSLACLTASLNRSFWMRRSTSTRNSLPIAAGRR